MSDSFDPLCLDAQLCFPLYAASKALVRRYEPFLEPLGLTYTQYIVMLVMWEKKTLTVNDLGERVHLDSGTLSPLIQKLIAKGYLCKARGEDARFRYVSLTEKGEGLREKALPIPTQIGCCLNLTPEEAQTLYRLCYKTLEGLS